MPIYASLFTPHTALQGSRFIIPILLIKKVRLGQEATCWVTQLVSSRAKTWSWHRAAQALEAPTQPSLPAPPAAVKGGLGPALPPFLPGYGVRSLCDKSPGTWAVIASMVSGALGQVDSQPKPKAISKPPSRGRGGKAVRRGKMFSTLRFVSSKVFA